MPDVSPSIDLMRRLGLSTPPDAPPLDPTIQTQQALKSQENDPIWKKYAETILDSGMGGIKGLLGFDPTSDKSNSEYLGNATGQILGAGLPFLDLLGGKSVFHGTGQVFEKFDPTRYDRGDILGHMTHFAEDPAYAENYAYGVSKGGNKPNPNIIAAQPQAKNVLDLTNPNIDDLSQVLAAVSPGQRSQLIKYFKTYRGDFDAGSGKATKILATDIREELENPSLIGRTPFDAVRYNDMGHKVIATPSSTPVMTPSGLSLNDAANPIKILRSDTGYGPGAQLTPDFDPSLFPITKSKQVPITTNSSIPYSPPGKLGENVTTDSTKYTADQIDDMYYNNVINATEKNYLYVHNIKK